MSTFWRASDCETNTSAPIQPQAHTTPAITPNKNSKPPADQRESETLAPVLSAGVCEATPERRCTSG